MADGGYRTAVGVRCSSGERTLPQSSAWEPRRPRNGAISDQNRNFKPGLNRQLDARKASRTDEFEVGG